MPQLSGARGIVALGADQSGAGRGIAQQWCGDGDVGNVAAGQSEGQWPTGAIDHLMDFDGATAARAANSLAAVPLLRRWPHDARTAVPSIIATPGGPADTDVQRGENVLP